MPSTRRAVLLSSGALLAGTASAVAPDSVTSVTSARSGLTDQNSSPKVTGTWSSYKHDSGNTGYAAGTTGPRGSVGEL